MYVTCAGSQSAITVRLHSGMETGACARLQGQCCVGHRCVRGRLGGPATGYGSCGRWPLCAPHHAAAGAPAAAVGIGGPRRPQAPPRRHGDPVPQGAAACRGRAFLMPCLVAVLSFCFGEYVSRKMMNCKERSTFQHCPMASRPASITLQAALLQCVGPSLRTAHALSYHDVRSPGSPSAVMS